MISQGKLSEVWARVTKGAIAENIMNLTKLSEVQRSPGECVRCPTLWLALASLCVLDNDHVERLSSAQWRNSADGNPPPPRVRLFSQSVMLFLGYWGYACKGFKNRTGI